MAPVARVKEEEDGETAAGIEDRIGLVVKERARHKKKGRVSQRYTLRIIFHLIQTMLRSRFHMYDCCLSS